ncbi:LysR family transcriptional regulator [Caulobacter sp. Root343]|uniref:LysR family transcriptional regulator n=2 Tax=unclassified Caulobacter TaxID=2648921 RepID=UPI0006FEE738|nr:LysR family transcriptional regulator [Caulobacter sp. Root343]KQV71090.1 LysR family transcriptional regulator [Caulobacter sp. Root343]
MSQDLPTAVDWERQRAFLAVIDTGSLSAAARQLGAAQPTVRRRVEDLEGQLGVALFTRSPSGLTPTPLARELAQHARAMAIAAASLARAASAEADAASGAVRITASEVVGMEVLPSILADLREAHPGLVFELALTNRSEDLLRREADIAVRMVRPTQEALLAKRVGNITLGMHAHKRLLDAWGRPTSLDEARRLPLIGYETETIGVRAIKALGLDLRPDEFTFRTDNDVAQLAAIRAGLGLGLCQVGLAARDPMLERVLPEVFSFDLETFVVTHEDLKDVRRVRLVFDALVTGLTRYAKVGNTV